MFAYSVLYIMQGRGGGLKGLPNLMASLWSKLWQHFILCDVFGWLDGWLAS